ncbi:MAG: hypothetical protein WAW05_10090 [Corynebacterium casei]
MPRIGLCTLVTRDRIRQDGTTIACTAAEARSRELTAKATLEKSK